ncbi:MAG: HDIG domain-containing protein [Chloroflexi bacterium]|nr:HDIG domain-containing protein [Chloroflexota bacterium]
MIPRQRTPRRVTQTDHRQVARALLIAGATALAMAFLLVVNLLPRVYEFREGDVSPVQIKAPRKITFVSQVRTREARDAAAAAVPEFLDIDADLVGRQRRELAALLQGVATARADQSQSFDQKRESIKRLAVPPLDDTTASWLAAAEDTRWLAVRGESQRLLADVLKSRISDARAQQLPRELPLQVSESLNEGERHVVVELTRRFVRSNLVPSPDATARARKEAADAVAPVQVTVEAGESVLREGQKVTAADLETLEALGLRNPTLDWRRVAANGIVALMAVALVAAYIAAFHPSLLAREKPLILIALVTIATVAAAKVVLPARPMWVYVFPLPAVAMLLTTLIDARLGIIVTAVLAMVVAYLAGGQLELAFMGFIGAVIASAGVYKRERLQAFFVAGLVAGAGQFVASVPFAVFGRGEETAIVATIGFECLVAGLVAAALTAGSFSVLGRLFGITTTWQLMELTNPSHPLLRRLLLEAPGTYHHSIMVGNLAERAAEEVGADPLLARVVSYYHDVGKLRRPVFFIENQADGVNPHETLDPEESARIVRSHVLDGTELAQRYGLPARVRDMIPQHHGTRLVSFFYQRAAESGENEPPTEAFRYPGPRPQSKEAAIVMLSDSVEAATRAARDRSPEAIRLLVDKIVYQRVSEGELDECDITLRDLHRIKASFCALLQGMYHPRIEYPEKRETPAPAVPGEAVESAAS